jgi:HEAT repeat protein
MNWLLVLSTVTVAGSVGLAVRALKRAHDGIRAGVERRVAGTAKLTGVQVEGLKTVSGRHGALRVQLGASSQPGTAMRVVIEGLVSGIRMAAKVVPSSGGQDVEIGDPRLDGPLVFRGAAKTVRASFPADVRERLVHVLRTHAVLDVHEGILAAELREGTFRGSRLPGLSSQVDLAIRLAHALEPGASDESRLVEILRADPLPAVRANAVAALAAEALDDPLTRPALREATLDAAPEVRLRAAVALGEDGHEVLYALASDPAVEDAIAVRAVEAFGAHLTLARAEPLLAVAAADLRVPVVRAVLASLGRGGAPEAAVVAALLARRIGRESSALSAKGAQIAVAAAEALGQTASPAGEATLIAALGSDLTGVPAAAARSLGGLGTALAVPALRQAEERGGEIRRAAREAIALIQSRLEGATPGQVSLAGGEAGQVSVVDTADGRVSLEGGE